MSMTQGIGTREDGTQPNRRESSSSQESQESSRDRFKIAFAQKGGFLAPLPIDGTASVPNSRQGSVKREKSNGTDLEIPAYRSRTNSLPSSEPIILDSLDSPLQPPKLTRVRSFTKTPKGVVNRGDSIRRKRDKPQYAATGTSNTDLRDPNYSPLPSTLITDHAPEVTVTAPPTTSYFHVVLFGAVGVGKASLKRQFMTSEYMGASDNDGDDESETVSVLLNGDESTVDFIDSGSEDIPENVPVDGYLVVFSITDRRSFEYAKEELSRLRHDLGIDRAIVLVGNKIDLVRKRTVSVNDAKSLVSQYDCRYLETSAAINHKVDDLLVEIVTQMRIKLYPDTVGHSPSKRSARRRKRSSGPGSPQNNGARGLISRILNSIGFKSKRKGKL